MEGIAYLSYNTRYTEIDSFPPYYDNVDKEQFWRYTPLQKVKDFEPVISRLKSDKRFRSSQVILHGQSEGAIIATMLAKRKKVAIDALFLTGMPADDVYSTICWQNQGGSSMVNFYRFFDRNNDKVIQRQEYTNADPRAIQRVGGKSFRELDLNSDSVLTHEDFCAMLTPKFHRIMKAIEEHDNPWIWENYFRVGIPWVKAHQKIAPNKERLLELNLPVFVFHGEEDVIIWI